MSGQFPIPSLLQMVKLAEKAFVVPEPEQATGLIGQYVHLAKEELKLENTIYQFNLGVDGSFKAGGVEGLKNLCTGMGYERMQQKYSGWRSKQIKALNLVECSFLSFDLLAGDPKKARVYTFEKWVFVYENGEEVKTRGSIDGYDLFFENDTWKVDHVETFAREA